VGEDVPLTLSELHR